MIGTEQFERAFDRAYVAGTRAELWGLPTVAHTHGLDERPRADTERVSSFFNQALKH